MSGREKFSASPATTMSQTRIIIRLVRLVLGVALLPPLVQGQVGPTPFPPAPQPPPPPTQQIEEARRAQEARWNDPLDLFNTYPNGMRAVDVDRVTNRGIDLQRRTIPVYLPPLIPALHDRSPFQELRAIESSVRHRIARCVGERFYVPYASLMALNALSEARQERVEAYLATRQRLADDLRHHLGEIAALSPVERVARLDAFARSQFSALRSLEADSARIHADLTTNGFLKTSDDGGSIRAAINELDRTGDKSQRDHLLAVEAAFYHPGLTEWQRSLLDEIALEDALKLSETTGTVTASPPFFFFPATSRIPLSSDLPADVVDDMRRFSSRKNVLKSELRAVVVNEDFVVSATRTARYQQLGAQQEPTWQELEALAERIRSTLIGLPSLQPPKSRLPRKLITELGSALERKREWEAELASVARQIAVATKQKVEVVRDGGMPALQFVPDSDKSAGKSRIDQKTQARVVATNEKFTPNYRTVLNRIASLLPLVDQFAAASTLPTRQTSDEIVQEIHEAFRTLRDWARYRDYHTSVLQPGLSPEQRLLLYRVALADLATATITTAEAPTASGDE